MVASIHGSSIRSIRFGSGMSAGLWSSIEPAPCVSSILYTTLGAVVMRSRSYSRVSRSWMISRWSSPRNPQRKPKPSAALVSISNEKDASLSRSLEMLSRNFSKSAASTGNRPQKTTGWTSLKPGSGAEAGGGTSGAAALPRVGRADGDQAAEDDGLAFLEAGERLGGGALDVGDGVADAGFGDVL